MVNNSFIEKDICCMYTLEFEPTAYVTEYKEENYLEIYIFQVSCPLSRLRKRDKMLDKHRILSLFPNSFNNFNQT